MKDVYCCIGIPTNRLIKAKTASSLLNLVNYSKNIDFSILTSTRGYNTSENRNYIASQVVKSGCSHLLFIDDDMIFLEDTLERLLVHDKDIIGGVYKTKYEIQEDVIEYLDDKRPSELFKVGAIGTGCLLIKTEVFKKVPQIWFNYEWFPNGMVKMSHDWLFCHKAREYGFDVWADPTLEIKHIGLYEY